MTKMSASERKISFTIYRNLSFIVALALLVISGLAFWGHKFSTNMVHRELSAQRVYFPEAGSPEFSPEKYARIQKYAGQLVDNGQKAEAYANGFIGQHLKDSGGGKTYSEISALAMQNPDDQKLQALRETLLQGETLRGVLLSTGYAFGTIGMLAGLAALALLIVSASLVLLGCFFHLRRA